MDEMETGFKIAVGTEADTKSVDDTVKELNKSLLSQLKDGGITIPATLKFKDNSKASSELKKTQSDFVKKYNDLAAKGFSASEEEFNDFIETYKKLTKGIYNENQKGTAVFRTLKESGLVDLMNSYNKQFNVIMKEAKDASKVINSANKSLNNKGNVSKPSKKPLGKTKPKVTAPDGVYASLYRDLYEKASKETVEEMKNWQKRKA